MSAFWPVLLVFTLSCWSTKLAHEHTHRHWTKIIKFSSDSGTKTITFQINMPGEESEGANFRGGSFQPINKFANLFSTNVHDSDSSSNSFESARRFTKLGTTNGDSSGFLKFLNTNGQNSDSPSNSFESANGFTKLGTTNGDSSGFSKFFSTKGQNSHGIFPSGLGAGFPFIIRIANPNSVDSNANIPSDDTNTNAINTNLDESKPPLNEFPQFAEDCLAEHNNLRVKHGAPLLRLSKKLNDYAQQWADRIASTGQFRHRSNNKYGENLFMSGGMQIDGRSAVRSWYDEIKLYTYGSGFSLSTGHFTQVVWRNSRELGCAFARRGNSVYVVANYDPPGNYPGAFASNVLPPQH